jgi:glyoxylase-like metal-dependent hydrolase (beta-lactamase superfamily II)
MRNGLKITLGVVGAVVIGLGVFVGPIAARIPSPQADRITGSGVVGIVQDGSIAWVIETATGVVLIDAGGSQSSDALRAEINQRPVHAILLTHGHFDHTGGVSNYPQSMVIAGPGESGLVTGQQKAGGWMARMSKPMMGEPDFAPPTLREFTDGEVIEIDGATITAIHVPGHTKGSAAYLWGDVLFVGDTIIGRGDHVSELPKPLYDDYDQVPASVAKMNALDFEFIADGHAGFHPNAKAQITTYLAAQK